MTSLNTPLADALLQSFNQHHDQLTGKRLWLACSGGRDSLSLALLCRHLYSAGRLSFLPQLLHVNHRMQPANHTWARQVNEWAHQHHMSCQIITLQHGIKSEQSARQARYQAMSSLMNHEDVLMLGHHKDDQVETVLMRLFSGAGINGLAAMSEMSTKRLRLDDSAAHTANVSIDSHRNYKTIALWRPLLKVSRAHITTYARANQLPYIDDPTNVARVTSGHPRAAVLDSSINTNDRAWLRGVLMPVITERYPKAVDAIFRASQHMQNAGEIIEAQNVTYLKQLEECPRSLSAIKEMHCVLDISKLQQLSAALQSSVIHAWLKPSANELPPSTQLVGDILNLAKRADNNHQTCLYWHSGVYRYEIRRYQQRLYRLRIEWLEWLNTTPETTEIPFDNHSLCMMPNKLSLKSDTAEFTWQFIGLPHLMQGISKHLPVLIKNWQGNDEDNTFQISTNSKSAHLHSDDDTVNERYPKKLPWALRFQPLPTQLKLTLAGRKGSKSGKKLLQALNQPAFVRNSVVLCSMIINNQTAISASLEEVGMPLFIIGIDGIYGVESKLSELILAYVDTHKLHSNVIYSHT